MTTESVNEFRFDGGSPWLNFAATIGRAYSNRPQERLKTPADLDAWFRQTGLSAPAATSEDLATARNLRTLFRRVSEDLAVGADPTLGDLDRLAELATPGAVVTTAIGIGFPTVRAALGALALSALMTAAGPERHRLSQCQDHDCAWVFHDPTGRQHWCSTRCGNRARVRAHRARGQTIRQAELEGR